MTSAFDTDRVVSERYAAAAESQEAALCCPIDYDARYLKVIPDEVIQRDYGCGDPSKHVRPGETVLDLGSGGGKICFIASQVVGPQGRVIGVDMNDAMLQLAKRSQPVVAQAIGYDNVEFRRGKIQDLAIDRDVVDAYLQEYPVRDERCWRELEALQNRLRKETPMIADQSIDVVVSNCVLNLVDPADKQQLFAEIFRVLKPGGRAVISDIVSDGPVPLHLQKDSELWSGCISGAFQEREFLARFEAAGFTGIELTALQEQPWRVVEGIEFRSATVIAYRGLGGPAEVHQDAVIYRGPFAKVCDEAGRTYQRGVRTAVSRPTLLSLTSGSYAGHFIAMIGEDATSAQQATSAKSGDGANASSIAGRGEPASIPVMPSSSCCGPDECC